MGKIADRRFLYFIPIFVLLALLLRKPKIGIFYTFIFCGEIGELAFFLVL